MAHVHALKLTGTLAGSGWTDNGSAGAGCSQSSVLSGTQLTQSVDAIVALEAEALFLGHLKDQLDELVFVLLCKEKQSGSLFDLLR